MDKNPTAFPQHPSRRNGTERTWGEPGMTLRDWFAGQALSGQLANRYQDQCSEGQHARRAYDIADAMLAAREAQND